MINIASSSPNSYIFPIVFTDAEIQNRPDPAIEHLIGTPIPQGKPSRVKFKTEENQSPTETKTVSAQSLVSFFERGEILKGFKEEIGIAAQKRIAAVFQQLVLAYQTQLHFELGYTEHQGESAKQIQIPLASSRSSAKRELKMDASHNSTIPCLYAYSAKEWDAYLQTQLNLRSTPVSKPEGVVYLKGSYAYHFWNSTIPLPKDLNIKVDNRIDIAEGLRKKLLSLLNRAARGEIKPDEGTIEFANDFHEIVTKQGATETNNQIKEGFLLYKEELDAIRPTLEDGSAFAHYLAIRLHPEDKEGKILEKIYELSYKPIRTASELEGTISKEIEKIKETIRPFFGKRSPPSYEAALKELVIENMPFSTDKTALKKFFCTPYSLRETNDRTDKIQKTKEKIKKALIQKTNQTGLQAIQHLSKTLSQWINQVRVEEVSARKYILKELRKMRQWTQQQLASRFKELFPDAPASQPTISRCERGTRDVDPNYATQLSHALQVDASLFMPKFFFSI